MAPNEGSQAIPLQEVLPHDPESAPTDLIENSESRFSKSNRTYIFILLGSSLSQLPIWGKPRGPLLNLTMTAN